MVRLYSLKPVVGVNYLSRLRGCCLQAFCHKRNYFDQGFPICCDRERLHIIGKVESGLAPHILILNNHLDRIADFGFSGNLCIPWSYPSPLRTQHTIACRFRRLSGDGCLSDRSISLLISRIGEFFVCFDQDIRLPAALSQLVQLPSQRLQLPSGGFYKTFILGNQFVSLFSGSSHLLQLVSHDPELAFENQILQAANNNDGDSEKSDSYRSVGSSPRSTILGGFLLLCGAAIMKIAFERLEVPHNPT